jgi:hypothetical protein
VTDVGYGVKQVGNKPIVLVNLADTNGAELAAWVNGVQLRTTLFESAGGEFKQDLTTGAFATIAYEHHEIHSGSHFFISGFEELDNAVSINFGITTPNTTKWLHMTFEVSGTSQTEFYVYEGSTISGGTAVTPVNNNFNSDTISGATVVKNPTVSANGTLKFSTSRGLAGATPSKADTAGFFTRSRELVLKQNTTYVFRITSRQDDNIVSYIGEWYEHTNR